MCEVWYEHKHTHTESDLYLDSLFVLIQYCTDVLCRWDVSAGYYGDPHLQWVSVNLEWCEISVTQKSCFLSLYHCLVQKNNSFKWIYYKWYCTILEKEMLWRVLFRDISKEPFSQKFLKEQFLGQSQGDLITLIQPG